MTTARALSLASYPKLAGIIAADVADLRRQVDGLRDELAQIEQKCRAAEAELGPKIAAAENVANMARDGYHAQVAIVEELRSKLATASYLLREPRSELNRRIRVLTHQIEAAECAAIQMVSG